MVFRHVIDLVQSAYIKGRNILESFPIINKIWSWARKVKEKKILFKVDFEKAFNSINWGYLESIIHNFDIFLKIYYFVGGLYRKK